MIFKKHKILRRFKNCFRFLAAKVPNFKRGGEGEMYGKSNMETYITICKIDIQQEFAVCLRKLKHGLCINLEGGMGSEMGGGSKGKGYMYQLSLVTQSCPTLCDPMNCSTPGFPALHHLPVQFSSVAQSCLTLCNPMNHSTPGLPVHHQLPESTQTHVHRVDDAIQTSHPLSSPSQALNLSQHQGIFQ